MIGADDRFPDDYCEYRDLAANVIYHGLVDYCRHSLKPQMTFLDSCESLAAEKFLRGETDAVVWFDLSGINTFTDRELQIALDLYRQGKGKRLTYDGLNRVLEERRKNRLARTSGSC